MKIFFLIVIFINSALGHEKKTITRANQLAWGIFTQQKFHRWPFPLLSIGHSMQSYQNYSGSPYWHDGLDIRSREGQSIQAATAGTVVNIENYVRGNDLYWEIAIRDDEGFVWKYHHVDHHSIPREIFQAFQSGEVIAAGTFLGNVVRWPIVTFGETFHHLHLLIVGKNGTYINPFLMMEPLEDTVTPVISRIGILQNHHILDRTSVRGPHALFVEASDLVLHDKFILPPHRIAFRLNGADLKEVWKFIHLPSGTNDVDFIRDFYLKGTCGDYHCRKFLINLNFSPQHPRGQFNLAKGEHHIEVIVEDLVGNQAIKSFSWQVE